MARGGRGGAHPDRRLARYSFAHALVGQMVYEELSIPVRLRLHERIAEALEERHEGDLDAHLAEVAHHLFQCAAAGNAAKAVAYARRAAHRATRLLAYEDGALHYTRALELLDLYPAAVGESAEQERAELLLALAEAQSLAESPSVATQPQSPRRSGPARSRCRAR